jgi:peptidoglycan/xylan/chitin deacetylase (PgdA/CDA1 family)
MRRLLLPAASAVAIACAAGVLVGALPVLPTVPAAVAALLALSLAAALQPSWRLFGPALVRADDSDRVALTFDDGPDPEGTPRVLDALDAAGMKATFFAVGQRAEAHPELLRDIAARGHEVGNHSMHHRWTAIFSRTGARRELQQAQATLGAILGAPPTLYRPPIGLVSPFVFEATDEARLPVAAWSLRTLDGRSADPDALLRRLSRVRGGDVVLLHDGGGPAPSVIADVVRILQERGLRSVTVTELFGAGATFRPSRSSLAGVAVRTALALLILSAALAA